MSTPARAHRQRTEAAKAHTAAQASRTALANAKPYELMLAKLHADMGRLRDIQSIERKIEVKRELLPTYDAWVDGVLAADSGQQDDVFTSVMVWHIDTGNYERGLALAGYAMRHGLKMPARYKRDTGYLIAEEIAEAALKALAQGGLSKEPAEEWAQTLGTVDVLTEESDMPDIVRAKLKKAYGLVNEQRTYYESALLYLRRALELDSSVGVKKDIERVQRALKQNKAVSA